MAGWHPQLVHFTIALTVVGVLLRLLSLLCRPAFLSPAAATLLLLAALFGVLSTRSGIDAHGPVERAPGARPAVQIHETWGERAHNVLVVVGLLELAGLLLRRSANLRYVHIASAAVGVVALFTVWRTAGYGGDLVYRHAGGVGIRSGDPADVHRLLLAGLYQQSLLDRAEGRHQDAADLINLALRRQPQDPEVQLLVAESLLLDGKNPQAAIEALGRIQVAQDDRAQRLRRALLQSDAFEAAGQRDAAIAVLQPLIEAFPGNGRIQARLDALRAKP